MVYLYFQECAKQTSTYDQIAALGIPLKEAGIVIKLLSRKNTIFLNNALWLDVPSHVNSFNKSEFIISAACKQR